MSGARFTDLIPYHEVQDSAKLQSLIESMKRNGWTGEPLVEHQGYLLNGSHRFAAACEVLKDNYQFKPQVVSLEDIVDLSDVAFEDIDLVQEGYNWQLGVTELIRDYDASLIDQYGLDIH